MATSFVFQRFIVNEDIPTTIIAQIFDCDTSTLALGLKTEVQICGLVSLLRYKISGIAILTAFPAPGKLKKMWIPLI